jgi:HAD superfamily hydrolase (TIGR01549 family)
MAMKTHVADGLRPNGIRSADAASLACYMTGVPAYPRPNRRFDRRSAPSSGRPDARQNERAADHRQDKAWTMVSQIDYAFLDMGGVIVRDDVVEAFYFHQVFRLLNLSVPVSADAFFRDREARIAGGQIDWLDPYVLDLVSADDWAAIKAQAWAHVLSCWKQLSIPLAGIGAALARLASRTRLALIANQPAQAIEVLEALQLRRHFGIVALDCQLPYSKPDIRMYQWALARAGVAPQRVLMIGDRIDNDIYPARLLNMRTAWIRTIPRPVSIPDVPKPWRSRFFASIRRVGKHNQHMGLPHLRHVAYDLVAPSLAALFHADR